jgi:hypothetical protein
MSDRDAGSLIPMSAPSDQDDDDRPRIGQEVLIEMRGPNGGRLIFRGCRVRSMERDVGALGDALLRIVLDSYDVLVPEQETSHQMKVGGDSYSPRRGDRGGW